MDEWRIFYEFEEDVYIGGDGSRELSADGAAIADGRAREHCGEHGD